MKSSSTDIHRGESREIQSDPAQRDPLFQQVGRFGFPKRRTNGQVGRFGATQGRRSAARSTRRRLGCARSARITRRKASQVATKICGKRDEAVRWKASLGKKGAAYGRKSGI